MMFSHEGEIASALNQGFIWVSMSELHTIVHSIGREEGDREGRWRGEKEWGRGNAVRLLCLTEFALHLSRPHSVRPLNVQVLHSLN